MNDTRKPSTEVFSHIEYEVLCDDLFDQSHARLVVGAPHGHFVSLGRSWKSSDAMPPSLEKEKTCELIHQ